MDTENKATLSLQGRSDEAAVAVRMLAARKLAGLSQKDLSEKVGRRISNISNIERAKNLPGWGVMLYFHHSHRVDVNFLMTGAYAQLPGDVQEVLFPLLDQISKETDLL